MLDRLSAEEDLAAATMVGIGHRMRGGQWTRDTWRSLERAARGRRGRTRERASRPTPEGLAAAGIAVRVVERTKTDG